MFAIPVALLLHFPVIFEQKPYATGYTPNSVLKEPLQESRYIYAENKPRISTCGGAVWFRGKRYLFANNMETSSIQVYAFNERAKTLTPVRGFANQDGLDLRRPESIAISPDEAWIAIPNMSSGNLQLYSTEGDLFLNPIPRTTIRSHKLHGVGFSPDGKTISFTSFGNPSGIYTVNLKQTGKELDISPVQFLRNQYEPLRPKSIAFSPDGRFAAIGYCTQLSRQKGPTSVAILATYQRSPETGWIDPVPISEVNDLFSTETIAFYPDGSCLFAVDQIKNRVTGHGFDRETGRLGITWVALENPASELDFCHGIAITSDGKYMAVTSYGDDKVTVYQRIE